MKFNTLLEVFKRNKKSTAINLEYILIYQDSGQPIFTKCWGEICGKLGEKDELLTAFLSAISTMPTMFAESDKKVQSVSIGSLKLLFSYTSSENIICLAFQEKNMNDAAMQLINELIKDISKLLDEDYQGTSWDRVNDPKVRSFEKELLEKVFHPKFHVVSPCEGHMHDEECPICVPMILRSCP